MRWKGMERRFTMREAAKRLNISERTVTRRVRDGVLRSEREPWGDLGREHVWVILDVADGPAGVIGELDGVTPGLGTDSLDTCDEGVGDGLHPEKGEPPEVTIAVLRKQLADRDAALADYKQRLEDSEYRYHGLVQEMAEHIRTGTPSLPPGEEGNGEVDGARKRGLWSRVCSIFS